MGISWLFASDIDNTLTGDLEAMKKLKPQLMNLREIGELFLALSTGRRLEQVLGGFEHESLPESDAIISQVGTEIYLPPFSEDTPPLKEWETKLLKQFSRQRAVQFLEGIDGLEIQPAKFNTPLKVSCYLDGTPDPDQAANTIKQRVEKSGESNAYQVIWSSGRDLDIIPAAAGKGKAIQFLIDFLELSPQRVIVAGDSGNDRAMFDQFKHGIIVNNAQPELKELAEDSRPGIYFSQKPYAAGVAEGLRHFDVIQK